MTLAAAASRTVSWEAPSGSFPQGLEDSPNQGVLNVGGQGLTVLFRGFGLQDAENVPHPVFRAFSDRSIARGLAQVRAFRGIFLVNPQIRLPGAAIFWGCSADYH